MVGLLLDPAACVERLSLGYAELGFAVVFGDMGHKRHLPGANVVAQHPPGGLLHRCLWRNPGKHAQHHPVDMKGWLSSETLIRTTGVALPQFRHSALLASTGKPMREMACVAHQ